METSDPDVMTVDPESRGRHRWLAGLLIAAGLGLAGRAALLHLRIAARVGAGNCDGCAPWHPLFVVSPLVVGTVLLIAGGYLLWKPRMARP